MESIWKLAGAGIIMLGSIFGLAWGAYEKLAFASDIERVELAQNQIESTFPLEMRIQLNQQSMREMKSKIADIEENPRRTQQDVARKDRMLREVDELRRENLQLERMKIDIKKKT